LKSLIDFTTLIEVTNCKIEETNYKLTCDLNESQIELAKEGFNAVIILDN
jgi:hypothetical protein